MTFCERWEGCKIIQNNVKYFMEALFEYIVLKHTYKIDFISNVVGFKNTGEQVSPLPRPPPGSRVDHKTDEVKKTVMK